MKGILKFNTEVGENNCTKVETENWMESLSVGFSDLSCTVSAKGNCSACQCPKILKSPRQGTKNMTLTKILVVVAKNAKTATTIFGTIGKNAFSNDTNLTILLVTLNKLQQREIPSK